MIEKDIFFYFDKIHNVVRIHHYETMTIDLIDREEFFDEISKFLHRLSEEYKEPNIMKLVGDFSR